MKTATLLVVLLTTGPSDAQEQKPTAPKIYRQVDGVMMPKLVREVHPTYPVQAMRDGIQGVVVLECVVNIDGGISDIRVVKPLEPELDAAAATALKAWQFTPGSKDGVAVPIGVEVEMAFTFRAEGPRLDSPDVYIPGQNGVTMPKAVETTNPTYTPAARAAGIVGGVTLQAVVLPNGRVGDVRIVTPLDAGLDVEAVRALRRWRFEPGKKDDKPVPTKITVDMTFTGR